LYVGFNIQLLRYLWHGECNILWCMYFLLYLSHTCFKDEWCLIAKFWGISVTCIWIISIYSDCRIVASCKYYPTTDFYLWHVRKGENF
jgi:hypothetical protein